ncbi:MAG: metal-dependent hydrolase [Halobacteriota archaeon]
METEGHVGAALLLYSPIGLVAIVLADGQLAMFGGIVAVSLAMAPDVDLRIPVLKHRGSTHTVWFALAVGLVTALVGASATDAGVMAASGGALFGFLVGAVTVLSHLAADSLTPAGIRPFWPIRSEEYSFEVTRASNPVANYLLLGLGGGVAISILAVGQGLT